MGCHGRLTLAGAARAGALVLALAACGEDTKEQQRRELLTPPNKAAIQAEKKEKAKVVDEEGALLPSDLVLGGFTVPRGFEVTKSYTNEWVLHSKSASARITANYVDTQVFTGGITRTSAGGFRFESAQLRKDRSLPRVAVRVSPIKGQKNGTELVIRSIPVQPAVERPPADVVEAQLRNASKFAQ
jgi:hypothetical protein